MTQRVEHIAKRGDQQFQDRKPRKYDHSRANAGPSPRQKPKQGNETYYICQVHLSVVPEEGPL